METSFAGRCISRLLSRWTVIVVMTLVTLWGIHQRIATLEHGTTHTINHIAVIPSASIR
jgi:hypothetical protein